MAEVAGDPRTRCLGPDHRHTETMEKQPPAATVATTPLDENTAQLPVSEPDLAVFSEEQQQVLHRLRRLPPAQRMVAALYYDGLTAEEIAATTGKPATTVRSHLRHARTTLKEVIASDRSGQAASEP
jgi:RNA polymerase sigma factor (sigma-70 family)